MMSTTVLVRYGAIPEVAEFAHSLAEVPLRNVSVVVETHRGLELGTVLDVVRSRAKAATPVNGSSNDGSSDDERPHSSVVRVASAEDRALHDELRREAQAVFSHWDERNAECVGGCTQAAKQADEDARQAATISTISMSAGVVLLGTATFLFLSSGDAEPESEVVTGLSFTPADHGASVSWAGHF